MQFIPLTPICSGCLKWAATDERLAEYRLQGHCLLHQPVEQQTARPGGAAVETKGEFVEVIVQMVWAYRALVSAEQPPLEQGSNSIDPRQQILSRFNGRSNNLVFVAQGLQSAIALPAIGLDASAWLDGLLDSRLQTPSRRVGDAGQANPPDLATICLGHNQYQTLASGTAPALARLWPADEGLIDLHHPGQTISARSNHCPAQLVQPVPSRPITAQTQHPLHAQSAGSQLLVTYQMASNQSRNGLCVSAKSVPAVTVKSYPHWLQR